MLGKFLFTGTAASAGVPVIGCNCPICTSSSPKNKRLRSAGVVFIADQTLLIDIGPDFRQQALTHKIENPNGLLLTHTHYDHIAGIDELRVFNVQRNKSFPCLLSKESSADLQKRYFYLFRTPGADSSLTAQLDLHILEKDQGALDFLGIKISYMSYFQGGMKVNGFRIGDFAYISDIREYDASIFKTLHGVRKLVLSALRAAPSRIHFTLEEAVEFAHKVGAEETRLTHLSHSVDYEIVNRDLPPDVQLGYDGLTMEFIYR